MSIVPVVMEMFKRAARAADARALVPPGDESMKRLHADGWSVDYRMTVGLRPVPPIAIIKTPEGRPVINRYETPEDYARYRQARYNAVYGNGKADKAPSLG